MPSTKVPDPYRIRFFKDRLKFSSAHFTLFKDGQCEKLHGHNYRVSVEMGIGQLDMGLACPFQKLKALVEEIIEPLDEMVLMPAESPWISHVVLAEQIQIQVKTPKVLKRYEFPKDEVFMLPSENVSSECLAEYLYKEMQKHLESQSLGISLRQVCVMESNGQEVCFTL